VRTSSNSATFADLVIKGGQAAGGGGILSEGGMNLFNSRIHDNTSGGSGGGISGIIVTLDGDSTVSRNSAVLGDG
jgi:hypothetical protein